MQSTLYKFGAKQAHFTVMQHMRQRRRCHHRRRRRCDQIIFSFCANRRYKQTNGKYFNFFFFFCCFFFLCSAVLFVSNFSHFQLCDRIYYFLAVVAVVVGLWFVQKQRSIDRYEFLSSNKSRRRNLNCSFLFLLVSVSALASICANVMARQRAKNDFVS